MFRDLAEYEPMTRLGWLQDWANLFLLYKKSLSLTFLLLMTDKEIHGVTDIFTCNNWQRVPWYVSRLHAIKDKKIRSVSVRFTRRNVKLSDFLYNRNKFAQSCSQPNLVIVSQSLSFTDSIRHHYLKLRQDIFLCWQSKMFVSSYFTLNYLRFLEYTAIQFIGSFDFWDPWCDRHIHMQQLTKSSMVCQSSTCNKRQKDS
jgi:hypothetical protein